MFSNLKSGWVPDAPDSRDFTVDSPQVRPFIEQTGVVTTIGKLPAQIDLRQYLPRVIDQNPFNSCTAATTAALTSYFQCKAHGRSVHPSVLFLYKVTRNLLGVRGDAGALLRTSMQALRLFGSIPIEYWPDDPTRLEAEPQPFHYAYAGNYRAKAYYRLDDGSGGREDLLARVRTNLAAQLPSMFGFYAFASIALAGADGAIRFPSRGEPPALLHALVAVGYDDNKDISTSMGDRVTRGALRVRNSWGTGWGEAGYGWLPYDYVLSGLTSDWWSLVDADFVDTGQFGVR